MPIDVDSSNWNKENIWDVAHLIPSFPEAEIIEGAFEKEENSENRMQDEVDSEESLHNSKMPWNSRKRKRGAEEDEKSLLGEQQVEVDLINLRCWWPIKEQQHQKGNAFAFESIFKSSKVVPSTFISSPKPTMKGEQQSRKSNRVVLGELTDFILSPLRKRADESLPPTTIGENGMDRSHQNGITV